MPDCPIPSPGLGTWRNTFPGRCERSIATAIDIGYNHVDTARAYGNEDFVGRGVRMSTASRDDVFIATKVHPEELGYQEIHTSVKRSLSELQLNYIDLLYVHWPALAYDPYETWEAFDELWRDGLVKHIGASNFTRELLEEAQEITEAPIVANQVEMHPLLQQEEMLDYIQSHDMYLVAYSPIARGRVFDGTEMPEMGEIAAKHDASEAQVSLAWLQQKESVVPIPMADIEIHQRENYRASELELDRQDVRKIESISRKLRLVDPDYAPWRK